MILKSILAAASALFLASCSSTTTATTTAAAGPDLAAEEKTLRDIEAAWSKEMVQNDPAKQALHYAPDAVLIGPGMPAMKGIDAIRAGMKEMMSDPNLLLQFQTERVDVSKDATLASTEGSYKMTMTDPKSKKAVQDTGSYETTYRKQDGKWLAVVDIASSSGPAK